MPEHDNPQLKERISGNLSDSVFEGLQHEKSRKHIIGIITDYVDHVDFMTKVRKYASDEMDKKMFMSIKFWVVTVLSSAGAAIVGVLISKVLS